MSFTAFNIRLDDGTETKPGDKIFNTPPVWLAVMESPDHLAVKAADFITTDRILEYLNLEKRFDAMVDRAMRRLAQMKFMKQIAGSSERLLKNAATLQFEAPRKPRRQMSKK